ncbi:MAG: beta-lactamase family protein [Flavobacteriales bacterium]|nr:beta-lactamase family protein [Flavobacteriales bacterium]
MRHLLLATTLALATATTAQNDSANAATARRFAEAFERGDYEAMHDELGGPLALLFRPSVLKNSFGQMSSALGTPHLDSLVKRSPTSYRLFFSYGYDPTESDALNVVLSKKARIVGMGNRPSKLLFAKDSVQRDMPTDTDLRSTLDAYLLDKHTRAAFDGCVMLIDSGRVRYSSCLGLADRRTGETLTDTTLFELASCSKPFTASAIMRLTEQGRLRLDDRVQQHLPELPYRDVTIRQLLSHTGGLPDYMELLEKHWNKERIATNADVLAALVEHKPKADFKPGKREEYSNTGYVLLACLIERITGRPYAQAMDELLFRPAGLERTRVYNTRRSGEVIPAYAYGSMRDSTGAFHLPDSIPDQDFVRWLDGITGDGTVNSNLHDFALWDAALRSGTVLSFASQDSMTTVQRTKKGEPTETGLGWFIDGGGANERVAHHSGGWPGYATFVLRFLDRPLTVVVLSNTAYMRVDRIAKRVAEVGLGK